MGERGWGGVICSSLGCHSGRSLSCAVRGSSESACDVLLKPAAAGKGSYDRQKSQRRDPVLCCSSPLQRNRPMSCDPSALKRVRMTWDIGAQPDKADC